MRSLYRRLRETLEPSLALLLLLALAPLFALTALAIAFESRGPVFYRQRRVGRGGRAFELVKFRSMRANAETAGPQWACRNDARVTRMGHLLRATRLDELPQLWNILRGEMSFIGPRPERPEFHAMLSREIAGFEGRTAIKPGLTGWAQVHLGYASSVEESRNKFALDLYYIEQAGPLIDLKILVLTMGLLAAKSLQLRGEAGSV